MKEGSTADATICLQEYSELDGKGAGLDIPGPATALSLSPPPKGALIKVCMPTF